MRLDRVYLSLFEIYFEKKNLSLIKEYIVFLSFSFLSTNEIDSTIGRNLKDLMRRREEHVRLKKKKKIFVLLSFGSLDERNKFELSDTAAEKQRKFGSFRVSRLESRCVRG